MYCYQEENLVTGEPNRQQTRLEGQLAGVFAWLFALVAKLDREAFREPASFRPSRRWHADKDTREALPGQPFDVFQVQF